MKRKYNYFYKITNHINNHFYFGVHCTDNLDDGYMGSGTRLHYAYKKYGIENFSKEILKYFDTIQEAYDYEAEIVTEDLVNNPECYNIQCGGKGWNSHGTVSVIDKDGNKFRCSENDPKYLSNEYVGITKNRISITHKETNKTYFVNSDDERLRSNDYKIGSSLGFSGKNKIAVKDNNKNYLIIDKNDPRYLSGELVGVTKNMVPVKDNKGNIFIVSINDPRYLSGEVKYIWKDRKHKKETIEKMHKTHQLNKHQQGEKNSQYGTCWIYKFDENNKPVNIKIKKEALNDYIKQGYIKGRFIPKKFGV